MTDLVPFAAAPLPAQRGGASSMNGEPPMLSRRAKAAIVVRLLLNDGADLPLEDLPEDLQAHLTKAMGHMRSIDRDTLHQVVEEFASQVENVGLSFPGGMAGALSALDGRISPHTSARLRKEAGVREAGDPWARIREMGTDMLLPILEDESIEIAAVMLSKLDVSKAAELLGKLPGPRARQITYAVSMTGAVTPDAVDRIGLSLASQLDARPVSAFDDGPVERVGAILNSSTSITREDMLAGLDETDEGFAEAVRKAIFTFGNIPVRIAPRDVPRILREIDQDALITALAGAEAMGVKDSAEFLLSNMSARLSDQLRDEMSEAGEPTAAEADAAMAAIVTTIRQMETAGDLMLAVENSSD